MILFLFVIACIFVLKGLMYVSSAMDYVCYPFEEDRLMFGAIILFTIAGALIYRCGLIWHWWGG